MVANTPHNPHLPYGRKRKFQVIAEEGMVQALMARRETLYTMVHIYFLFILFGWLGHLSHL
jgi:hypothetical protein